ncbi:ROK family protein [Candidatus Woesearchaeota archaeon]|nr:MAG: glucokinase [archaeon GW2011_AR4]MBS3130752.1 ROK family protein [Candidatus Woesearchaeota archaeon]HIH38384.1 ROK family protein [Candidatus Woesearchaeota archaeon]HIH49620.1 ROK family protein [Candidatus Woesearchaeota archaeon]HIJ03076.1 ROK family protein [Candidatus Woesearchaeota archaeon]
MLIGIDIGGTKIHAGLFSSSLKLLSETKVPTQGKAARPVVLKNIAKAIDSLHTKPKMIGVGIAGTVKNGKVDQVPNIPGLEQFDLAIFLKKRYHVPIKIENDAKCFTIGQQKKHKAKHLVGLTLGTGVGGGIIIDGKLYHGMAGTAGELGHMIIKEDGIPCHCGSRGCLEMYIAGKAIKRRYKELTGKDKLPLDIAKEQSKAAKQVIRETGYYLGVGLANIVNAFNPEVIVVGGSIAMIDEIFPIAKQTMEKRALKIPAKRVKIVQNKHSGSSILGAASLCMVD